MAAEKGRLFILKVGDGLTVETFTTLVGRSNSLAINNELVDVTDKSSNGSKELLDGEGVTAFSMSASGVFKNSATEILVQGYATAKSIQNYEIIFENGSKYSGPFIVSSLEFAGEYNGETTYSLSLEGAGAITFTAV